SRSRDAVTDDHPGTSGAMIKRELDGPLAKKSTHCDCDHNTPADHHLAVRLREIFGAGDMRRPLNNELGSEDRSVARRWAVALPSFYSIIVIILIMTGVLSGS